MARRIAMLVLSCAPCVAAAADVACPQGTRVVFGDGSEGTVLEAGTGRGRTGWWRIASASAPDGAWHEARVAAIRPAAAPGDRCVPPRAGSDAAVSFGPDVANDDDPPRDLD